MVQLSIQPFESNVKTIESDVSNNIFLMSPEHTYIELETLILKLSN